jgi:hypothetical protein
VRLMSLAHRDRPGLLLRRWRRSLRLSLLCLGCVCLAGFVLAATAAAPMPLRLHLPIGRRWPQFRLGLGRFCHHECTFWQCAIWCIAFLASAVVSPVAKLPLPFACPDLDGEPGDRRSSHFRTLSGSPRSPAPRAIRHDSQKPCRLAAFFAGTIEQSPRSIRPVAGSNAGPSCGVETARLALSSGNALPMGSFHREC